MSKDEIGLLIIENISPIMNVLWIILGSGVAIFIGGVIWAWKLSSVFTNFKNDTKGLTTSVLDISRKLSHIDSHLVRLDTHDPATPNYKSFSNYTQASSPLTLTPEGEKMVNESGFYDVLTNNQGVFEGIIANAEGRADKEAFIEKASFEKINTLFEEDNVIVAPVNQYMYEQGMRQSKLKYNGAIRAFSVAARDSIFERVGIKPPIPGGDEE